MTAPVIAVPAKFSGTDARETRRGRRCPCANRWLPELIFDSGQLDFIRLAGVVFLSNLVHWLRKQKTTVKFAMPRASRELPAHLRFS